MRIQVICGAGASSTFVAARLRRAALTAGSDWEVSAAPVDGADPFADLILLGSHIAALADEIGRRAPRARVVVLPEDAFTDLDGTRVHAIARSAVDDTAPKGTP